MTSQPDPKDGPPNRGLLDAWGQWSPPGWLYAYGAWRLSLPIHDTCEDCGAEMATLRRAIREGQIR